MGFHFGSRYQPAGKSDTRTQKTRLEPISDASALEGPDTALLRLLTLLANCGLDAAAPPLLAGR